MSDRIFSLILLTILFFPFSGKALPENNIVIESQNDTYRFIPSKDGQSLDRVEHSSDITFRANKSEGTAKATIPYNDDVKIDKATGGTVDYVPYYSEDVFFSDSKACRITAPIKKAGGKTKVSYKRTFTKPEFLIDIFLFDNHDIERQTVRFEIPLTLASRFNIVPINIPAEKMEKTVSDNGKDRVITFTVSDTKSPEYFSDAPSMRNTMPKLRVNGHFADHNELYRYLLGYIPTSDPGEEAVKAKALELTAGCTTDLERITAVNDFVHSSIRYVAVEHGEYSHRPDLPSEVLRKLYGDCKCSAGLMRAMLRSLGMDARYVWVGTNVIPEDWTDAPNLSTGDHMIAAVMTGDSILYLDGTAVYNPVNAIPASIQGQQAMIEDSPEKCLIARIPLLAPESNLWRERLNIRLQPSGAMDIDGQISLSGSARSSYAYKIDAVLPGQRDNAHARFFESGVKGSHASEASCEINDSEITVTGKATANAGMSKAGNEAYFGLNPMPSLADMKFDMKNRNVDGEFNSRQAFDIIHTLHLPEGFKPGSIPADMTIENEWFTAEVKTTASDDGKNIDRSFRLKINKTLVPFARLESVNADIHKLARALDAKIGLITE